MREIEVKTKEETNFFDEDWNIVPLAHSVGEWVATKQVAGQKHIFYISVVAMELEYYCMEKNEMISHSINRIEEVCLRR